MSRPDYCPWCGEKICGFYGGWFEAPHDCPKPDRVELARRRQMEARIKVQTIGNELPSGELFWMMFGRYILANRLERGMDENTHA